MQFIAHRGASHDAPENTVAAVRLAWAQHADAVEVDVHLTRDGRLAVVACAFGMMSKEVMVTAPIAVLLYDRTFVAGSFGHAWRSRRSYYLLLGSTWLILAYLLTTGLNQRSVGFGLGVSPLQYALTECRAVLLYLKLAVWPSPLVFDYGAIYAAPAAATIGSVVLIALLLAWTFIMVRRGSAIGFAAGCFCLLLAPTSTFVPVAEQPMAENRTYLPLAALLSAGLVGAGTILRQSNRVMFIGAAAALGLITWARNEDFRCGLQLWADTASKRPENPRAQYNCAIALVDAGRIADSVAYFKRSIALKPDQEKAHNSLGSALLDLGRLPEALTHLAEAIRLQPSNPRAWHNSGLAQLRHGHVAMAIEHATRAVQLDPTFAEAHATIGNAYFKSNRPAYALEHYMVALRLNPRLADAHYNAGSASLELRQYGPAIEHFAAAVRLKPADPEIRLNHGAALLQAGRATEAIAEFEHALRLKPDYRDARDNLEVARRAAR